MQESASAQKSVWVQESVILIAENTEEGNIPSRRKPSEVLKVTIRYPREVGIDRKAVKVGWHERYGRR